jgi:ornithine decarboxylase
MHISTSPYYPLLAGLEMNALLHEKHGKKLWEKAARNSIFLKREIFKQCRIFKPFLPATVHGRPWESYEAETILKDPAFYALESASRNGFSKIPEDFYMLDPCKVLVTTCPIEKGKPSLPAPLVSAYLEARGITAEKSDFYTLLFLSQPGDTEEKASHLVKQLCELEDAYFSNRPLSTLLPGASSEGLRDFIERYRQFLEENHAHALQQVLFSEDHFPKSPLNGRKAREAFIKGNRKCIPLSEAEGKIALELVLPYPPGIAVLVPGEVWTKEILSYFLFLEAYGKTFPEYKPEILGVHKRDSVPYVWVYSD